MLNKNLGHYTARSVTDPVYSSKSDYHAWFICTAHLNCQNIGFTGHFAKIYDNIGLLSKM